MRLPDAIEVVVAAAGRPLPGVLLNVTLVTERKNNFELLFGPTDVDGKLQILREEMLQKADEDRRFFIMDYGHPEGDFAGNVIVSIFSRGDLKRAFDAYPLFKNVITYPPAYLDTLQRAQRALEQIDPAKLTITLTHSGQATVKVGSHNY